ncbi:MAG TPA: hypothetical protein VKV04_03495 [Verrucomicrobiae bacterium]|nr:hypothetical protein [Verrucomicrobiae bacterium]
MNTILEVAIGLFFVFLLFSLLTSAINEAVFGQLRHLRSRVLEDSLHAILSEEGEGFSIWSDVRRVWIWAIKMWRDNPPEFKPFWPFKWIWKMGCDRISKVWNHLFEKKALKEFRAVLENDSEKFSKRLLNHPLITGLTVGKERCPHYLPAETFVDAAMGTLLKLSSNSTIASSSPSIGITIEQLMEAVDDLKDEKAKTVLRSILASAENVEKAREQLETWFNNSMERVTGAYKRYSQFWLFAWATIIVVWLNVDSIEITQRLLSDAQFRSTLATGAVHFMATAGASNSVAVYRDGTSIGTGSGTNQPAVAGTDTNRSAVASPLTPGQLLQEAGNLNLPLGWGACTNATKIQWIDRVWNWVKFSRVQNSENTNVVSTLLGGVTFAPPPCPETGKDWWLKILGLLITITAIGQGAPFWFDMLNRVTNLRAAGKPPARRDDDGTDKK